MRSLFFLTMVTVMLLGIDAAEFNGRYLKAVWHELGRQSQNLQSRAERSVAFF
jgi:hypothetical protein